MIATVVLALRVALAIALYTFLGWALYILMQELRQQGGRLSTQKKPGIRLLSTLNRRESQHPFNQPEILIGRDSHCDLSLMDEAMSAHHARVTFHHGQWWLEDLNSRNGTFLNREKLSTPAVIISGDQFKCGNTLFDVQVDSVDEATPADV